jgi:hypothetical protein
MPAMGALLGALGAAVRALGHDVIHEPDDDTLGDALAEVRTRRARCAQGATRRARLALDREPGDDDAQFEGEWLNYAALLVQVDRIVVDLSAPLPS